MKILSGTQQALYMDQNKSSYDDTSLTMVSRIYRCNLDEQFYDRLGWDCLDGFLLLGEKNNIFEIFEQFKQYMIRMLNGTIDKCVPECISLLTWGDTTHYIIIGSSICDEFDSQLVTNIVESYKDKIFYRELGGIHNDDDHVTSILSFFYESEIEGYDCKKHPLYPGIVEYFYHATRQGMYNQLYGDINKEDYDSLPEDLKV